MARTVGVSAALVLVLATACGGGGSKKPAANKTRERTIVNVQLQDFALLTEKASAPPGLISFQPRNAGPKHEHEFVVVRTTLAPDKLPVKADGSVDETSSKLKRVGEIEEIPVGSTGARTFTLTAGEYVLFCNVVEKKGSTTYVHYKLGMRSGFIVR